MAHDVLGGWGELTPSEGPGCLTLSRMMCNVWSIMDGTLCSNWWGLEARLLSPFALFSLCSFLQCRDMQYVQGVSNLTARISKLSANSEFLKVIWIFFFFLTSIKNGTFAFGKNLDIDKNPREETKTAVVSPYQKNTNTFNPTWMWLRGVFH